VPRKNLSRSDTSNKFFHHSTVATNNIKMSGLFDLEAFPFLQALWTFLYLEKCLE
jgi:hypothetical protein